MHKILLSLAALWMLSAVASGVVSANEVKSSSASGGGSAARKPQEIVVVGSKSGKQDTAKSTQPKNLTGPQTKQGIGLLLPAIQKDPYLSGGSTGGGGSKPQPKPKEDCMSCPN